MVTAGNTYLGPDAQVDQKALLFLPTDPALTDPFPALVEDDMSAPGFEWHPHRGLETVTTVIERPRARRQPRPRRRSSPGRSSG